jgi:hypothetical protein
MFQTVENLLSPALSSFLRQEERELQSHPLGADHLDRDWETS